MRRWRSRLGGLNQTRYAYLLNYLEARHRPEIARPLSPIPAITAPLQPRRLKQVTITPAINIPIRIDKKAYLNFKPKRTATIEPVQAPVNGRGMATNNAKPIRSYLSTVLPRFLVRSENRDSIRLKMGILLRSLEVVLKNNRIKSTGNKLPMIANERA
jgi:hypothetical protein